MSFPGFQPPAGTPLTFLEAFSAVLDQYRRVAGSLLPVLLASLAPITLLSRLLADDIVMQGDPLAAGAGIATGLGRLLLLLFLGTLSHALSAALCLATFAEPVGRAGLFHRGVAGLGRAFWLIVMQQLLVMAGVLAASLGVALLYALSRPLGILVGLVLVFVALALILILALAPALGLFWGTGVSASIDRSFALARRAPLPSLGLLAVFGLIAFVLVLALHWPLTLSYIRTVLDTIASGSTTPPVFTPVGWQRSYLLGVGLLSPAITALPWLATGVVALGLKAREEQQTGV